MSNQRLISAVSAAPRLTLKPAIHRGGLRLLLLSAALLTSACIQAVPDRGPEQGRSASVSRVILYADTVTVEMADRSLCTGPRTTAGPSWRGTLAGCKHLWPYQVQQPPFRVTRLPLAKGGSGSGLVTIEAPGQVPELWSGPAPRVGG